MASSITAPRVSECVEEGARNVVATRLGSTSSVVLTHQQDTETQKRAAKRFNCSLTFIVPYEAYKTAFHFQVVLIKILQLLTNTINLSHRSVS